MVDPTRFLATFHLLRFWDLVPPWLETEDAAGTKVLPAGAHQHELGHWIWTHRVWSGYSDDRFVQKRIGQMTDDEFRRWCSAPPAAMRAWVAWIRAGART